MGPAIPPAALEAGWSALERDDLQQAEQSARTALSGDAAHSEAHRLLGYSLLYQGRFEEALPALLAAQQAGERRGLAYRIGHCQLGLGDFAAAELALRREIALHPDMAEAYNTLGVALVNQSRLEEALAAFREAAALAPHLAEASNNLANVLSQLGRHEDALPYLQNVIRLDAGLAEAHYNLATLYQALKRHDEAAAALEEALRLSPRLSYALGALAWNKLSVCRWTGLEAERAALRAQVRDDAIAAEPFAFLSLSPEPREQLACARAHAREQFLVDGTAAPQSQARRRGAGGRRIRVAYLSADFGEHATAYLAAGLFERHERSAFEVVGVSYGEDDGSPMRRRLERAFERFVDVRTRSDANVAAVLREMEIDIAVDLKGYTTGARPGILAQRPAPLQASFLGFPGTMGVDFIDYLIADRTVVPESEQACYAEKLAYLPECYQVNDSSRAISERTPARRDAGLPEEGVVFCCFNNNYKIQPEAFACWMRLLREVPGSVLWLLKDSDAARANLQREAREAGIDAARLVFAARAPHAEHLARHRLADLFLDTLPYNAHTTASDALWAGLPVLTCLGTSFAGRVAASLLQAVGLPELITRTRREYEDLALELVRDAHRLQDLKAKLARSRMDAPLFDTVRFTRALEAAYRTMWQRWCRGEPARSFALEAQ